MQRQKLKEEVRALGPWFHNYEIAAGVWTNPEGKGAGLDYPANRWGIVSNLLPDLRNKTCLDIGASSGFFSLKLKELGAASVLGIDDGEQPRAVEQGRFAAAKLALEADFRTISVYDVHKLETRFDVVLFMGVLYHLRHPLLALERIRSVCAGTLILQTITTPQTDECKGALTRVIDDIDLKSPVLSSPTFPALRFIENKLNGDVTCWFVPNVAAVGAMLRSSGFSIQEVVFASPREVFLRCRAV
jgi:tRNA (mo5U34)-methyltransferase